jgi:hypothetical protein
VRRGPGKVHIVTYTCEYCGAEQTCQAGMHADGMCHSCGFPMRIDELFSDRRIVTLPVPHERRDNAA